MKSHTGQLLPVVILLTAAAAPLIHAAPSSALSLSAEAVNACPVVNAGRDTTVRVGYTFRMSASATDDSQPNTALVLEWRIVSGPSGGLEIILADAPRSLVLLKAPGDYVYEFSAFDGECTSRDSVRITILDSIPFTVLRPLSGERVARGEPYIVEWQIDPAANVLVEFSPDGGETFTRLTINSISGTRYTWQPAAGLALSDNCIIRVINYFQRAIYTDSSPFSLIDSSGGGVIRKISGASRGPDNRSTGIYNARGQRLPNAARTPARPAAIGVYSMP